jgi:hypothetical protein
LDKTSKCNWVITFSHNLTLLVGITNNFHFRFMDREPVLSLRKPPP